MKKAIIFIALILTIGSSGFAQDGIRFAEENWSEILRRAEQENKLIFLDAYTEWCGPCKMMTRQVFPTATVGKYFNHHFINAKMDMEKGDGVALAKLYDIRAYPTLLFINSQGTAIHRGLGYHDADDLLNLGEAALDPANNHHAMQLRYDNGDRNPDFLYDYAVSLLDAWSPDYAAIADAYLRTQPDWKREKNMDLIFRVVDIDRSQMLDYFLKNKTAFEDRYGSRIVSEKIQSILQDEFDKSQLSGNLNPFQSLLENIYPDNAPEMLARYQMVKFQQEEQYDAYADAAVDFYKKYPVKNWEELNEIAWLFFETIENPRHLKTAVKWCKQSIEIESNYFNNDTLASLYHKIGKDKKALKHARRAIEIAHRDGEDYSATEALIEEIESNKKSK